MGLRVEGARDCRARGAESPSQAVRLASVLQGVRLDFEDLRTGTGLPTGHCVFALGLLDGERIVPSAAGRTAGGEFLCGAVLPLTATLQAGRHCSYLHFINE